MKTISSFEMTKVKGGYEIFVTWGKRYTFTSKRLAEKFIAQANNLLFTELFKVNELLIQIYPETQRLLFIAHPRDKVKIIRSLETIQEMMKYCHFASVPNKTVYVIAKLEQCYVELNCLNEILLTYSKKASNTVDVYKAKTYANLLELNKKDFMEFQFVRLEKLVKNEEIQVLKIAS